MGYVKIILEEVVYKRIGYLKFVIKFWGENVEKKMSKIIKFDVVKLC